MANSLGTRPMSLDTAASGTVIWPDRLKISSVMWVGYTADAHTFVLTDKEGNIIAQGNGYDDLSPVEVFVNSWVNGLILESKGSGTVYIYVE